MGLVGAGSSAILVEVMKSRKKEEMIRAYQVLVGRLKSYGVKPKHHILDNEYSADFKEAIRANEMTF